MEKLTIAQDKEFKSTKRVKFILFVFAFLLTLVFVMAGAYVQEGYDIEAGQVSVQKFKSTKKLENIVATQNNMLAAKEAAKKVEPVMERDTDVVESVLLSLDDFFQKTVVAREELAAVRAQAQIDETAQIDEGQAVDNDAPNDATNQTLETNSIPIHLNENLTALILQMDEKTYTNLQTEVKAVTNSIFLDGLQAVDAKGLLTVKGEVDKTNLNADEKTLAYEVIAHYIKPNIVMNYEATLIAKAEVEAKYDTVYYLKDQTIVDEGQIISEEAFSALESLGLINKNSGNNWFLIGGGTILVSGVFLMFYLYLRYFVGKVINSQKEALLLFTLYVGTIFVCYATIDLPYQISANLIFIMLIAMLFDAKLSIMANILITIVCMLISKGDMEFLVFFIFTGTFVSFISKFTNERNKIIIAGSLTGAVSLIFYFGSSLFFERVYTQDILYGSFLAAGIGLVSVILSIGSAPFWEAVFGIVTPYRLIDLANPNSPILRRLTVEAPGTYHHSLIVANLVENAAYEIGANPILARAGGYYHDIGKLKYPAYFSENQVGINLHDEMDPKSSVAVIISHITYGIELANKNHVPQIIQDFIMEHQGTTLIKYFYVKAKRAKEEELKAGRTEFTSEELKEIAKEVDEAVKEKDFRYPFVLPRSKETALVMLADTVEAAARSMIPTGKSMVDVENLIRRLVKDKQDDGQLLYSGLTMLDIETTIQTFMLVFKGMYHERIPYPEIVKLQKAVEE